MLSILTNLTGLKHTTDSLLTMNTGYDLNRVDLTQDEQTCILLNVMIAETLEKVQHLNPDLYATWYSKLYPPHGNGDYWNVQTLHTLEQLLIDYAN